jgi:hypothetical protein
MIYDISEGPISEDEMRVILFLEEHKFKKVLDLGGVQRPWARHFVTHYADLIRPETWALRYPDMLKYEMFWDRQFITGDLEDVTIWRQLADAGPFDFVICTQVIEHLRDPKKFIERMTDIAPQGFVSVPHMVFELRKGIHWGHQFRGALPHRWICKMSQDVFTLFPKLNCIECMEFEWADKKETIPDLSFWWKDDIEVKVADDSCFDFADPQEAIDFLKNNLIEGE